MRWRSAEDSHRGNRRPKNEGSVFSAEEHQLWAVADGMGGHSFGDCASATITDALRRTNLAGTLSECVDEIEDLLLDVNSHLRQHAKEHCHGSTIGSTVVVFVARGNVGVALWAGDSPSTGCVRMRSSK